MSFKLIQRLHDGCCRRSDVNFELGAARGAGTEGLGLLCLASPVAGEEASRSARCANRGRRQQLKKTGHSDAELRNNTPPLPGCFDIADRGCRKLSAVFTVITPVGIDIKANLRAIRPMRRTPIGSKDNWRARPLFYKGDKIKKLCGLESG